MANIQAAWGLRWSDKKKKEEPIANDILKEKEAEEKGKQLKAPTANPATAATNPATPTTNPAVTNQTANPTYTPSAETNQLKANLDSALVSKPADFDYDQYNRILGMMENYQNREPFKYDLNADMLYQQYKNQYMQSGQRAMQDTVGQIAAVNGGYGNSYAQTAGQQAYQNELGKLNDVIPELYQLAYSRYAKEGDDMLQNINLANNAYQTKYGEYQDQLANWRNDVSRAEGMYSDQRSFDYNRFLNDESRALQNQQTNLDNYLTAMGVAGQNAGNKTAIDATVNELVRMGIIDENTARNLSGVYSSIQPAQSGSTATQMTPAERSEMSEKVEAKAEGYIASRQMLADFLATQVRNGYIDQDTSDDIYGKLYYDALANEEAAGLGRDVDDLVRIAVSNNRGIVPKQKKG